MAFFSFCHRWQLRYVLKNRFPQAVVITYSIVSCVFSLDTEKLLIFLILNQCLRDTKASRINVWGIQQTPESIRKIKVCFVLTWNTTKLKFKVNIIFPHFRFLSCISKLKAISAQKVFSMSQHHKEYWKFAKTFPSLILGEKKRSSYYKNQTTISLALENVSTYLDLWYLLWCCAIQSIVCFHILLSLACWLKIGKTRLIILLYLDWYQVVFCADRGQHRTMFRIDSGDCKRNI